VVYTRVIYFSGNTANITISEDNWCGGNTGTVDQPLPLYLSTRPEGWSSLQRLNVGWRTVVKALCFLTFQTPTVTGSGKPSRHQHANILQSKITTHVLSKLHGKTGAKKHKLTFKKLASYIYDGRTANLQILHFIYFFSTNISTEYFKHAAYSPFFSSKCRLFHNASFLGSCVIHIFHTGCAKI
jgi:hypothetical protein